MSRYTLFVNLRLFAHQDDADIDAPVPQASSGHTLGESGIAEEGDTEKPSNAAAPPKSIKCDECVLKYD